MEVRVYNRRFSEVNIEEQFKTKQSDFLYNTTAGRVLLRFIASKTFSRLNAVSNSGKKSVKKIKPFIEKYGIDMSDFEAREYRSFNDFFSRQCLPGKRPFSDSKDDLIAVADSKLTVYSIDDELKIKIKNSVYTVEELVRDSKIANGYTGGICLVFRLTVDDYHRYCFFDSGKVLGTKTINGCLHTVGPVSADRYKVFSENCRSVSLIKTENFGDAVYIEVGALLVGKIINHPVADFAKGDEKGWFQMGGSTVVILLKSGTVNIDADILEYSNQDIETKVKMGEKIGCR